MSGQIDAESEFADPSDLVARARIDPVGVRRAASSWLRRDTLAPDQLVPVLIACGWADYERSLFEPALSVLRDAGDLIEQGFGGAFRTQHVQASTAVLGRQGRFDEVGALAERAIEAASGIERATLRMMLAVSLAEAGQREGVLRQYELALRQARRIGNPVFTLQLLANRAAFRAERDTSGRSGRALADAAAAALELGHQPLHLTIVHNLGLHHARVGALPLALDCFARAESGFRDLGLDYIIGSLLKDQAEVLLAVGLLQEATAAVHSLVDACEQVQAPGPLADAHSLFARIAVADGRYRRALEHAEQAAAVVGAADMAAPVVAQADSLVRGIRALVAVDSRSGADPRTFADLAHVGTSSSLDVGLALSSWGHVDAARSQFEVVASQPGGSMATELDRTVAQALLAADRGADRILRRAVHEGLSLAESYVTSLGTSSTRASATRRLDQLCDLGTTDAMAEGDLASVLAVLERRRSLGLVPQPRLTPQQRNDLDELRRLDARALDDAAAATGVARHARERSEIERRLRDSRTRMPLDFGPSDQDLPHPAESFDPATGWAGLGEQIVYPFNVGDRHLALVIAPGTQRASEINLVELGKSKTLRRAIRYARYVLTWSASRSGRAAPLSRVRSLLESAFAPLRAVMSHARTVVVSDPRLPPVPWTLACVSPVVEVPSIAALVAAPTSGRAAQPSLVVGGAGVRTADEELGTIERHLKSRSHSAVQVLRGDSATAAEVLALLPESALVHLAAHGRFREDYPWFSELALAGGSLRFFDLLDADRLPSELVLAACDVGRSTTANPQPLVSALTQRGCARVVASSGQVNDAATATLMARFYELRTANLARADALHQAQVEHVEKAPSVAFFTCFGPPD